MAGDWIKWSKGLANRREVVLVAARLGLDRHDVAGRLMVLWEWADDNIPDSDIDDLSLDASLYLGDKAFSFIDALVCFPGFADAIASPEVRWLTARSGGRIAFPHFGRHNGTTAKTRALETRKKQRQRAKGKNSSPETVPKETGQKRDQRREEYSEQNRTEQEAEKAKPDRVAEALPGLAAVTVDPLPLGKLDGAKVFDGLQPEHLRNPAAVAGWFRRQLSATVPVLPGTEAHLLFTLCAAARATERGVDKPVGMFVSILTKRDVKCLARFASEASIQKQMQEVRSDSQ